MIRFRFPRPTLISSLGIAALLAFASLAQAQAQQYDQPYDDATGQSPGRVARLAYLSGQVQFAPAGEDNWGTVGINRPMVTGDRLLTGDDGLAALELGDSSIRIDHGSAFDFLDLNDGNVQIELSQGTLNLAVRQIEDGENFEVDTPIIAFVATTPGVYRIDNDPSGTGSMVTVFRGSGIVYGENGASRAVNAGSSYRFDDSALADVAVNGLPEPDNFDRFCEERDARYADAADERYVPSEMIGGDDLYRYGRWDDTPTYGNVWYPTSVPVGWAPYRYGHWAWIDPWGWTWVDDQPWGFAPFHYGRWAYVRNRWGWIPGPVNVRPCYAPALVAFIGGSGFSLSVNVGGGRPVGWFPLGPRDVYVPWYHASRRYFTNVNVTNIRNVYVNKTVINNFYTDYRAGRRVPPRRGHDYAYRNLPGAVTAVPRDVFTHARPVHPAVLRLNRTQLARTEVALRPHATPNTASLGLRRPTPRPAVLEGRKPFTRPVVARHEPPPRPVSFDAREKLIADQHGKPLTATQMRNLRQNHPAPANRNERVRLVPGVVAGAAGVGAKHRSAPLRPNEQAARHVPARPDVVQQRPAEPIARRSAKPTEPPFRNTVRPIIAPRQPSRDPSREAPLRSGELRSARFHPRNERGLPRVPVIRPTGESARNAPTPRPQAKRLPVVRPVEAAGPHMPSSREPVPRPARNSLQPRHENLVRAPQHREPGLRTQQDRERQMMQQQRTAERQQQMQRERQTQMQAQQRSQERQVQQQRAATEQQHARMQPQRQAQTQRELHVQQQPQGRVQRQQQVLQERQFQAQRQQQFHPRAVQVQPPPQRNAPAPRARAATSHNESAKKRHPDNNDNGYHYR